METKDLLRFYAEMLRIRLAEEKIAQLQPEQEMRCPIHLCVGQEATPVGVCASLRTDDYVLSNHRSHGHYIAKGGSIKRMFAELYGKEEGCAHGKGGSMHLVDWEVGFLGATPIVSSTIPIAVGVAMGVKAREEKKVSVAFFGDAAVEEGAFYEGVNFALLKRLPIIFVCENNFYSTHSPLSVRQPEGREIHQLAKGLGLHSLQGDGNDVEEIYRIAKEAIARTRSGEGPSFLEFKTYRWLEHCGPYDDSQLGYRTEKEVLAWKQKCPIRRLEKRLLNNGAVKQNALEKIRDQVKNEVEEAVTFAKKAPFPHKSLAFEGVYAT